MSSHESNEEPTIRSMPATGALERLQEGPQKPQETQLSPPTTIKQVRVDLPYEIDKLVMLARQKLRELGIEDNSVNVYRLLPTIRRNQLRGHYGDCEDDPSAVSE